MRGSSRCRMHGGSSGQARRAASRRVAEAKAVKSAARWATDDDWRDLNPVDALLKIAAKVIAFQEAIEAMLAELPEGEWRRDHRAGEQLHALVALFERALDRCAKVLVEVNKLGLEEKRIQIERSKAILIIQAIKNTLDKLGLTPEQRKLAKVIVPEEMYAISARYPDA